MSLITVYGVNPFNGQADPYLSLSSSISYDEEASSSDGEVTASYNLNGVLVGCSKTDLQNARDQVSDAFDWLADPDIPYNINIAGVIEASDEVRIEPASVDFGSSNYITSIPYTITLNVVQKKRNTEEDPPKVIDQQFTKSRTESTQSSDTGEVTIQDVFSISCKPDPNLSGCASIGDAMAWINLMKGRIATSEDLLEETFEVDDITSQVSYTATYQTKGDDEKDPAKSNLRHPGDLKVATCVDTETERPEEDCGPDKEPITIKKVQGEVYQTGVSSAELEEALNSNVLSQYTNIKNLSANYSNDSITFNFETKTDGTPDPIEPVNQVVNDYTVSETTNHDNGGSTVSVNGTYKLVNPSGENPPSVLEKANSAYSEAVHNGGAAGMRLTSESITTNKQENTVSYSFSWNSKPPDDEDKPGIVSYSVSLDHGLPQYEIVPVLNCKDYIIDKGYNSKSSVTISATATSGSGYDFEEEVNNVIDQYSSEYGGDDATVTDDTTSYTNAGRTMKRSYSATFEASESE